MSLQETSGAPSQQPSGATSDPGSQGGQPAPTRTTTLGGGAAPTGGAQPTTPTTGTQPAPTMGHNGGPDWRAMIAGDDTKALEILARSDSPQAFMKRFMEQQATLSKRAEPARLPDNATPQQVADYRKTLGVQDVAADAKPDAYVSAYQIKAPDGYTMSNVERSMIEGFAKHAYEQGLSPREVKASADFFFRSQSENAKALETIDANKQKEWQNSLRQEWGRDYDAKLAASNQFFKTRFADQPELAGELLNAQLPGGGLLGDHPAFANILAELATHNGMTDRIEASAMESGGKSLEAQQHELEALMHTNRALYNDPKTQERLNKIIEHRLNRGEIDENGNPVRRRRA